MISIDVIFFEDEPVSIKAQNGIIQFSEFCSPKETLYYANSCVNSLQLRHKFWIWLMSQTDWLTSSRGFIGKHPNTISALLERIYNDVPKRKAIIDEFRIYGEDNYQSQPTGQSQDESEGGDEAKNPGDLWGESEGGD